MQEKVILTSTQSIRLLMHDFYTNEFSNTFVRLDDSVSRSLFSKGLVQKRFPDGSERDTHNIALTTKGKRVLADLVHTVLVDMLLKTGPISMLQFCIDRMLCKDLPGLLVHRDMRVRYFARARMRDIFK